MKKNDIQKLKEMAPQEMERVVSSSKEALRSLRFDLAAGKVKDIRAISEAKKKIARLMTFINEKAKNDRK